MKLKNGIVIDDLKCVYWYIPKNACTSFKTFFGIHIGAQFNPDNRNPSKNAHGIAFKSIYPDKAGSYPSYFHFAIVRHPLKRLYSLYKNKIHADRRNTEHCINGVEKYVFSEWIDRFDGAMSFAEFSDSICSIPHSEADPHFAPQFLLLSNAGGLVTDWNIKMEELDGKLPELWNKLGVSGEGLPRLNVTKYKGGMEELPVQVERNVIKYYENDYNMFQYDYQYADS